LLVKFDTAVPVILFQTSRVKPVPAAPLQTVCAVPAVTTILKQQDCVVKQPSVAEKQTCEVPIGKVLPLG
jgi:hypothetical protein